MNILGMVEAGEISTSDAMVLAAIISFGDSAPSIDAIARRSGTSPATVKRSISKMESSGTITVNRDGRMRPNRYVAHCEPHTTLNIHTKSINNTSSNVAHHEPPTFTDVMTTMIGLSLPHPVDHYKFYDYYSSRNWCDKNGVSILPYWWRKLEEWSRNDYAKVVSRERAREEVEHERKERELIEHLISVAKGEHC